MNYAIVLRLLSYILLIAKPRCSCCPPWPA